MRNTVDFVAELVLPPVIGGAAMGLVLLLASRRTGPWVYRWRIPSLGAGYLVAVLLMWIGWEIGERRANVLTAVGGVAVISLGLVFAGISMLVLRDIRAGVMAAPNRRESHGGRAGIRVPDVRPGRRADPFDGDERPAPRRDPEP